MKIKDYITKQIKEEIKNSLNENKTIDKAKVLSLCKELEKDLETVKEQARTFMKNSSELQALIRSIIYQTTGTEYDVKQFHMFDKNLELMRINTSDTGPMDVIARQLTALKGNLQWAKSEVEKL